MKSMIKILAVFICVLISSASFADQVVLKTPAPVSIPDGVSQEEIKEAIMKAPRARGWLVAEKGQGEFIATLYIRRHMARELISVNGNMINFSYVDSMNLNYAIKEPDTDEELYGETLKPVAHIHSAYNGWVFNLANDIRNYLHFSLSRKE